jgi:magnesium transporter
MIRIYSKNKTFVEFTGFKELPALLEDAIWVDLHEPSEDEVKNIERIFDICMPTKDEMYGLEVSSRLYQENDRYFMTIFIVAGSETSEPSVEPVTFIIVNKKLITLRYVDLYSFKSFISRKEKISMVNLDGKDIMFSLLENIAERVADILERHGHQLDELSKKLFRPYSFVADGKKSINYENILENIGHYGDIVSKSRESLSSIARLVTYLKKSNKFKQDEEEVESIEILESDFKALTDHAKFVAGKINFLLDATLGMISMQQNNIIKIFTVATMMFLPPTLIASIYGMNFTFIPELHFRHGYYMALLLMALSAYIPYKLFKKKGWL